MSATIVQSVYDNPKTIEDKVRDLPANQGKNDIPMWLLIDTEVAQSISDGKIVQNQIYPSAGTNNKHGKN